MFSRVYHARVVPCVVVRRDVTGRNLTGTEIDGVVADIYLN